MTIFTACKITLSDPCRIINGVRVSDNENKTMCFIGEDGSRFFDVENFEEKPELGQFKIPGRYD